MRRVLHCPLLPSTLGLSTSTWTPGTIVYCAFNATFFLSWPFLDLFSAPKAVCSRLESNINVDSVESVPNGTFGVLP